MINEIRESSSSDTGNSEPNNHLVSEFNEEETAQRECNFYKILDETDKKSLELKKYTSSPLSAN